jgi:hypothetical protein
MVINPTLLHGINMDNNMLNTPDVKREERNVRKAKTKKTFKDVGYNTHNRLFGTKNGKPILGKEVNIPIVIVADLPATANIRDIITYYKTLEKFTKEIIRFTNSSQKEVEYDDIEISVKKLRISEMR